MLYQHSNIIVIHIKIFQVPTYHFPDLKDVLDNDPIINAHIIKGPKNRDEWYRTNWKRGFSTRLGWKLGSSKNNNRTILITPRTQTLIVIACTNRYASNIKMCNFSSNILRFSGQQRVKPNHKLFVLEYYLFMIHIEAWY